MNLLQQIDELANDFENGSSTIAKKGLQIFIDALNNTHFSSQSNIQQLKEQIINAKPSMSALKNIINQAYELYQNGLVANNIQKTLLERLNNQTKKCIELAMNKIIETNSTSIATCSFSSTVLKLFESLKNKNYSFQVYAYQSIWNEKDYSDQMIEACKRISINAYKINNKQLKYTNLDIGIIGADSLIIGKGVVNGIPSLQFAKSLKSNNINLYVIAESFKKSEQIHLEDGFEFIENNLISDIFSA